MKIITLVSPILQANCYLVLFKTKAIIIDPCVSYQVVQKHLENYKINAIFLTHGHGDHFSFLDDYSHLDVLIYMHPEAKLKLASSEKNLSVLFNRSITYQNLDKVVTVNDQQIITIDDFDIKTITTPGHSNCSICYLIGDNLFTGDTLFFRTVGRTDLYTSSYSDLQRSLTKLKNLNKDYHVYPGHGRATTLFSEIKDNEYF